MRDERRNVLLVGDRVDGGKFGLQRLQSQRLEPRLVHEALVQVGDLPDLGLDSGAGGTGTSGRTGAGRSVSLGLGETVDDPAQLFLSRVIDVGERSIGALVGRQLKAVQPFAV